MQAARAWGGPEADRPTRSWRQSAELSFAIDAWIAPQLSGEERQSNEEEKAQAWRDLAASCDVEPAAEVVRIAGVPSASEARALLASLTWAVTDVAA